MMRGAAGIAFITVSLAAGIGGWVWVLAARVASKAPPPAEIPMGDPIDAPVTARAAAPAEPEPEGAEGYEPVSLVSLGAFDYEPPRPGDAGREHLVPKDILALDGRRVSIRGLALPWDVEREGVKSFILSPRPFGCCFGDMARLNEVVMVQMEGDARVKHAAANGFVTACGVLSVSEERDTDGYTLSLYRMKCVKVLYDQ